MSCDDGDCLQCGRPLDGPPKPGCFGCDESDTPAPVPSDYERGVADERARVVALLREEAARMEHEPCGVCHGVEPCMTAYEAEASQFALAEFADDIEAGLAVECDAHMSTLADLRQCMGALDAERAKVATLREALGRIANDVRNGNANYTDCLWCRSDAGEWEEHDARCPAFIARAALARTGTQGNTAPCKPE